ncbi:uncharacterized protein Nmlp_2215 [Natronomonas moolapensis 8.8.11]|uniref:Uncharacterized protein n=1 Tax=Natronomonas moolapensis (strain DSM 18674 / CECT 7526 / JCM 14361 / 8.8.11) TaxID=268739 RepID=M1XQK9_NATM8|nr:hypothetical protein [Natronomonas moolapensis]CCQ36388.1 uncharacterized protein Nmlp_2215 [Natronomonas moolapensis 8.8.11]
MNCDKLRNAGALWAIGQGLVGALVPQLSVAFVKKMIGKNFENAGDLEAKPAYVRQIRALGIGLAAAGVATLAMDRVADRTDEE